MKRVLVLDELYLAWHDLLYRSRRWLELLWLYAFYEPRKDKWPLLHVFGRPHESPPLFCADRDR